MKEKNNHIHTQTQKRSYWFYLKQNQIISNIYI